MGWHYVLGAQSRNVSITNMRRTNSSQHLSTSNEDRLLPYFTDFTSPLNIHFIVTLTHFSAIYKLTWSMEFKEQTACLSEQGFNIHENKKLPNIILPHEWMGALSNLSLFKIQWCYEIELLYFLLYFTSKS